MATSSEADVAAKLLERLLSDPAFRARFRRDPAGACREAGLDGLAQEMSLGGGKAMHTLDMRESKSSLAGVMMAAAMEGVAIYQFTENVLPHLEEIPGQIADVLSRVDLPAIDIPLRKPPTPEVPAATAVEPTGAEAGVPAGGVAAAAAPAAPAPPPAVPEAPAAKDAAAAAEKPKAAAVKEPPEKAAAKDPAQEAAKKIAEENSPEAAEKAVQDEAAGALDQRTTGVPSSSDLPTGDTTLPTGETAPAADPAAATPAAATPAAAAPAAAAPAAAPEVAAPPETPAPVEAPPAAPVPEGGGEVPPPPPEAAAPAPPPEAAPPAEAAPGKGKFAARAKSFAAAAAAKVGSTPRGTPPVTAAAAADAALPSAPAGDTALPTGAPAGDTTLPTDTPAPGDSTLPTAATPDTTLPSAAPEGDSTLPTEPAPGLESTEPTKPRGGQAAAIVDAPRAPKRHAIDPAQFGAEGTGGKPDPEALALLKNKNVVLDADGIKDIKAGRIDPRVVGVLTKLSQEHKITVSCMCSDHPKLTSGGSVSNHHFGRGMDIASIDGEVVGPGSPLAREVASELSSLDPKIRPNEIGSPFAISGPGYFTDAAHQNHLHIGFKEPIKPDFKLPSGLSADAPSKAAAPAASAAAVAPAAAPAVAPVAPVAPVAAPAAVAAPAPAEPPPEVRKGSQAFLKAVTATAAEADRKRVSGNDSLAFLKAVEPPKASAAAAVPGAPVADVAAVAAAAPDVYPGDSAPREQIAAWMAGQAEKRGLPPELPLMASLVESGMKNLNFGDADSVGFFQMRVGIWNQGEYAGYPDKPELQVKWFLDNAEQVKKARIASGKPIDDPNSYGDWIADVERPAEQYRGRYQTKLAEAQDLLKSRQAAPAAVPAAAAAVDPGAVVPAAGGGSSLGAAALQIAQSQKGVAEVGTNTGPQVDQYLAAAKVAPGNPWCASFVTWSLEKAGHKMPGGGWAGVATWVRNAEQNANGLKFVTAEEARPGDIVAYDWGGQNDFGADGHIGFLESNVKDGKFTALEGNNADKVNVVPRQVGGGAKVVFIRVEGNAPPGSVPAPPAAAVDAAPAAAPAASQPIDPSQFGGEGTGTGGEASAEALALLNNKNIVLDSVGVADIKAGRIDPRVIGVLTKLSQEHKITVSCMCSDHSKFTAGGSVSNHFFGRGADIAAIDGEIVGPGSPLAREVASELSSLNPDIRPNEIGSPFAINGAGYFTDAAHQNHLHIGFKQEIAADWKPPAEVAASVPAAPVAAAAAVSGAPAAAAAAPEVRKGSQMFLKAVTAQAADVDRKRVSENDSLAFLKAVEPPKASAAAVDPAAAAPAAAPVDPAGAPPAGAAVDAAAVAAAAPDAYPGDNAPREQVAAWMAGQAQKRGLPPQLPLMASLVESGMKNLNFGDADSVGFFQMRVGIWNQGAYAGYPEKPELQVKWFLDQAEAVKRQRLVSGKSITDPNQFGEWIADVERPAAQYRGRYQTKLEEANGLLQSSAPPAAAAAPAAAVPIDPAAAAASAAAVGDAKLPSEILAPVQEAIAAGNAPGPKALAAIEEASKYIGTDYKWGGSTPQTGFDCSGLMQWAYAQSGVQIPRVTYTQIEAANGVEVDRSHLKPGDLVFFAASGDVHHVGMFLGGDKFLHAPSTGDVVKVSSLDEPYYAQQFAGGRRFDQGAGVAAPAAAPAAASAAAVAAPPAIDPTEVAKAQAAVARDAAEVRRNDSQLFQAVKASEASKEREKNRSMMFMKAIDPSQVKRPEAAAAAVPVPVAPAPVAPAPVAPVPAPEAAAPAAVTPPGEAAGVAAASIDLTNAATDYPGDDASQAELAKWLAKQAEKSGLPPELPVMASLVESGVKNLNFGDADSVGFFQMRVGIWNQGEYAGYPEKPELQAKWFIDQALAVKRKAIASGDADFGKDPSKFGEWIANVERPAEQYRGRYQLRLGEARKLLSN